MNWRKVDDYYMRSGFGKGQFYISKGYVAGTARYCLWSVRRAVAADQTASYADVLHGSWDSAEDAKAAAVGLAAANPDSDIVDSGSGDRMGADAGVGSG